VYIPASDDSKAITQAVASFGDFIKRLYMPVKDALARVKAQTEAGGNAAIVQQEAIQSQEVLFRAIDAAVEKGSIVVLENLGSHEQLLSNLFGALQQSIKSDVNGKLPKAILRLVSLFTTLKYDTLYKKLKFAKLQEYMKKKGGDEELLEFISRIVANAEASKKRESSAKPNESGTVTTQSPSTSVASPQRTAATSVAPRPLGGLETKRPDGVKSSGRVPSDSSPVKRPRDDDSDPRAAKKIATQPANGTTQPTPKPMPAKPIVGQSTLLSNKPWTGSALPGKSRPAVVKAAPKGDTPKETPKSDSTRALPTTKNDIGKTNTASKREAAKQDPLKPEPSKVTKKAAPKAEPSRVSKLGALLDEIEKPKAPPPVPTPESSTEAPETPEQKAKRLRKESRRKLRVTWKEGDELTQVRIFEKDVAEDEGREKNMLRDARDDRSEGMALKQSLQKAGELEDDEEDDLPYRPWDGPSPVDFSAIPADKRKETFTSRGGDLPIQTKEQQVMQDRENKVLLVIYTDPSEIPPTPRSPIRDSNEPAGPSPQGTYLPANDPKFAEIYMRQNEERSQGKYISLANAIRRVEQRKAQGGSSTNNVDATNVLSSIQSIAAGAGTAVAADASDAARTEEVLRLLTALKAWKDPDAYDALNQARTRRRYDHQDLNIRRDCDAVEEVAASLRGKPWPPTEPPTYITDPSRIKEWWEGWNKDRDRERQVQQKDADVRVAQAEAAQAQAPQIRAAAAQVTAPAPAQPPNGPPDYTAAWAQYFAQNPGAAASQQQQTSQYYNAYYGQQQSQSQAAPDPNVQLQALLATLGGNQAPGQQPAGVPPPADPQVQALLAAAGMSLPPAAQFAQQPQAAGAGTADAAQQAWLQWAAQQQQQQQPPPPPPPPPAIEDQGDQGLDAHNARRNKREAREAREARDANDASIPSHLRGINRALIGTKPCVFWANGKCAKGDKCTFRHD
jgi:hypothetical protein